MNSSLCHEPADLQVSIWVLYIRDWLDRLLLFLQTCFLVNFLYMKPGRNLWLFVHSKSVPCVWRCETECGEAMDCFCGGTLDFLAQRRGWGYNLRSCSRKRKYLAISPKSACAFCTNFFKCCSVHLAHSGIKCFNHVTVACDWNADDTVLSIAFFSNSGSLDTHPRDCIIIPLVRPKSKCIRCDVVDYIGWIGCARQCSQTGSSYDSTYMGQIVLHPSQNIVLHAESDPKVHLSC